jgi:hypothetical protein
MIRRTFLAIALAVLAGPALAQFELGTLKPIVKAVREGDDEKVRQALLKGENPNQLDSNGRPLLMVAVMAGQLAVVDSLLKGGAVADAVDRESYTSLIRAAEKGDVDIADLLLKRNAKPNVQTRQGVTALMVPASAMPRWCACSAGRPSQHARLHRPHRTHLCRQGGHHRDNAPRLRTRVMAAAKDRGPTG